LAAALCWRRISAMSLDCASEALRSLWFGQRKPAAIGAAVTGA
jgi:hypothetical protein